MHLCAQLAGQHSQRVAVRAGYHAPAELAQTACGGAVLCRQRNGVHSPPRAAARLHNDGPVTEGLLPACSRQRVASPGSKAESVSRLQLACRCKPRQSRANDNHSSLPAALGLRTRDEAKVDEAVSV